MAKHRKRHTSDEVKDGIETDRERFEQERMTRRAALRKMGLTTGMAIFSMLTIDDLARVSAKKLQEHEASKGIGDLLAREFRSAGVAFANPSGGYNPSGGGGNNPSGGGGNNPSGPITCQSIYDDCVQDVNDAWANTWCGWWNNYCSAKNDQIDQCIASYHVCTGNNPNPSGPPPNPSGPSNQPPPGPRNCAEADDRSECCNWNREDQEAWCENNASDFQACMNLVTAAWYQCQGG